MRAVIRSAVVPALAVPLLLAPLATSSSAQAPKPRKPAAAAETVYLVHGVQWDGGADCVKTWRNARAELRRYRFRGPQVAWGYYKGDTRCTREYPGSRDTPIKELGRRLAWDVHLNHSRRGRSVVVLAHSMGGLVVAAALAGVQQYGGKRPTWPPYLRVRDVVTLGTPYAGAPCRHEFAQCADLRTGSPFLTWLAGHPAPQGRRGTDWTLVAAHDDERVPVRSALAATARHKLAYLPGRRVGHSGLRRLGGAARWRVSYSDAWGRRPRETSNGTAPLRQAASALHSAAR